MVKQAVIKCLNEMGIIVDENTSNIQLTDYLEDSLSFIAFIVGLEEKFNIEVPDEYLQEGVLGTLDDVNDMINKLQAEGFE